MTPSSALAGITVLEICNVAAGPFCGMLLADMGADVIKVENPDGGDTLRSWPPISDGYSENFASLNRNKRSVTLNLKDPGDLELARELALTVDVLIENNRPGVMDRLGLGYEALKARNPRLVCSISAYGQSGPRAGRRLRPHHPGHERHHERHRRGRRRTRQMRRAAGGLLGRAVRRLRHRLGCAPRRPAGRARTSMCPCWAPRWHRRAADLRVLRQRARSGQLGSAHPRNAPYQAFRCKGGYFGMAAGNQALWKSVCAVVGRDDLLADARFADTSLRARNQDALREILEAIFAGDEAASWLARFREAGVPCAPINTYSEVLADPQVEHMGWCSRWNCQRRAHAHLRPAGALRRPDHGAASPSARAGRAQRGSAGRARARSRHERHHGNGRPAGRAARRAASADAGAPDKMNALSAGLVEALIAAVDQAQAEQARAIVFQGEGRNFSAGFDFGDWESHSEGDLLLRFVRIEMLLQRVAATPCLTVALAHGRNFGAGVDLFGACKWRLATPDASFRMPGLKFGLVLGTRRFAALVGAERARTILEQAATFDAESALRDGFVSRLAARDEWPAAADEARRVRADRREPRAAVRRAVARSAGRRPGAADALGRRAGAQGPRGRLFAGR